MAVGNAAEKYPKDPNSSFWSNKRLQGMFYLLEFGLCSWLDLQMLQWFLKHCCHNIKFFKNNRMLMKATDSNLQTKM